MEEIKKLLKTDIGRIVSVDQGKKNEKGATVLEMFRVKAYDNAHKRVWLVPNVGDWRNQQSQLTVGYGSIVFAKPV